MLKPWHTPEGVTYSMMTIDDKEDYGGDDIQQSFEDNEAKPFIYKELPINQQEQLRKLLEEYEDVLSSIPGRTELAKHTIDGYIEMQVKEHRLPWVHRTAVKKGLDMMLEHRIIEESSREPAQLIVIVPKKVLLE